MLAGTAPASATLMFTTGVFTEVRIGHLQIHRLGGRVPIKAGDSEENVHHGENE